MRPLGGGSIADTRYLELEDGRRFVAKLQRGGAGLEMLRCEAAGLRALRSLETIRVPKVIAIDSAQALVLEFIETSAAGDESSAAFGRALADMHHKGEGGRFGFEHDNFIGLTPQINSWSDNWSSFWRDHRLGYQLRLARQRGRSDSRMDRLGERLMQRLDALLAEPAEPPCLLHGDLWSGNYLFDERGQAVLIDPAVYYGRREAELAMTRLFGGFDSSFYAAYEERWPLAHGSGERIEIYKLYHLLNHLNLFGRGYYGDCLAILQRFAG